MDAIQFHLGLAVFYEFQDDAVEGFEWWRDCANVVHFVGVHDGSVLESSVYMDDDSYFLFLEFLLVFFLFISLFDRGFLYIGRNE